jgi:hypothetical protein
MEEGGDTYLHAHAKGEGKSMRELLHIIMHMHREKGRA